jgi:type IV pilus assembly protein PilC
MPDFRYTAYSKENSRNRITRTATAASREALAAQLMQQGFIPVSIEVAGKGIKNKGLGRQIRIGAQVKPQELAFFTGQLASAVSAGMPLLRALETVSEVTINPVLREASEQVVRDISGGMSPSQAMERHPKIFNDTYIALLRSGEKGGDMAGALRRLEIQIETQARMRREVKGALTYPAMVISFAGIVVIGMLMFIVPLYEGIYKELKGTLPLFTRIMIAASDFLATPKGLVVLAAAIGLPLIAARQILKTSWGRKTWDGIKLRLPKIGGLVEQVAVARFIRTFSTLSSSGVPLIEALGTAAPTVGNVVLMERILYARERIEAGDRVGQAFVEAQALPTMALGMVKFAEESGQMGPMLERVADAYEHQVEVAIKTLKSLMEPVMLVVVGTIIGGLVIGLYMPMFSLSSQIQV